MKIDIINRQEISNDHGRLEKIKYSITKGDESPSSQEREVYDHGDAVSVLLYNNTKATLLLTSQFRLPIYLNGNPEGRLTEACAGIVEEGEDPDATMIREIKEETGYEVDAVRKIYEAYSSPGVITEKLYLYLAEYNNNQKKEQGGGLKEEGENIELIELGWEQAFAMMQKGEIRDLKTITLLQSLQIQILSESKR